MKRSAHPAIPLYDESRETLQSRPVRRRDPEQPSLPLDPMPDRIETCLALPRPMPPEGPDWLYELKWDGYRLAIHIEPKGVRIITPGGHDWTHRFPKIAEAAGKRASTEALFFAFDLIYFDGHDLTKLAVRRHLLSDFLDGAICAVQLSEEAHGEGAEFLANACRMGSRASSPSIAIVPTDPAAPATGSRSNASRAKAS